MQLIYDAWDETYKKPFGAVRQGEAVTLTIKTDANAVRVVGLGAPAAMEKIEGGFKFSFVPEKEKGLYFYHFEADFGGGICRFGKCENSGQACENGRDFQLTVHSNASVPEWFKGKTMYQVYVDRFFKGDDKDTEQRDHVLMHTSWDEGPVYIKNDQGEIVLWDFFGGNLAGVIEKLPYIKDLGVDIIYLNPVFEAVSNHKYDTADYSRVDRMYGTEETLKRLTAAADSVHIKIMLDGVFSHTGEDSIYFNKYQHYGKGGAYNDKGSPYYPWYHFKKFPDDYDCWWGVKALPAVNELDPSFMHYLLDEKDGAVTKWMKAGVAGWRLDVADELPDAFIRALKTCVTKANPEAVLLGEVWEDASNKVSYETPREYILGQALDSVSNYPLRDALIDMLTGRGSAQDFANAVMTLQENYPRDIFLSLMNMTGTHDTSRLVTLLGDAPASDTLTTWQARTYRLPQKRMKLAKLRMMLYFLVLFTLPGNPCIYYGDEIGMQGYKDPYNRGTFDWENNDESLTGWVKQLGMLRKELGTKAGFVRFARTDGVLSYDVATVNGSYSVYINLGFDPVDIPNLKRKTVLAYQATVLEETLHIEALGACVLR